MNAKQCKAIRKLFREKTKGRIDVPPDHPINELVVQRDGHTFIAQTVNYLRRFRKMMQKQGYVRP